MPQVDYTVQINNPINEVFRFASNFNNANQWQPDVIETHQSDDKPRVGVMITQSRSTRLMGWRLDLNADILEFVPNKQVGYKGVLGRFPVQGKLEFNNIGGGVTQVSHVMDIRMGFLYAIFSPMMKGVMTRRTRRELESLKTLMENRSAASTNLTDFHEKL